MQRVADVTFRFAFPPGVVGVFSDILEVALDCCVCRRCRRTVILQLGRHEGGCTPTNHRFPGRLVSRSVFVAGLHTVAVYRIEYRFEPFEDAKYPEQQPGGWPTWGRVHFELTCPGCGRTCRQSTQTNHVRPFECRCTCGQELYAERETLPIFTRPDADFA